MTRIEIAIVQAEVAPDLSSGLAAIETWTRKAASDGAQLVVFGETWLPGYPAWLDVCSDAALWNHPPVKRAFARYARNSVEVSGPSGARLAAIARESGVVLALGVSERVESGIARGTLFNSLLVYDGNGALVVHHRKLVPTYTERLIWGPGDSAQLRAGDTALGRIGGLVCWEHWMPLARQALHESGEDVHVALWPTVNDAHLLASRHYAFEGRCFVIAAGSILRAGALPDELTPHPERVRSKEDLLLRGGSAVIGPEGEFVVPPSYDRETILRASLDLDRLQEERMTLDVSGHYQRPDCFEFRVRRNTRTGGVEPA